MSKNLDENNIYQLLYEEIPSDDDSETSCDDSDNDADYCLPSREVVISESSSDSEYEDSEILNLDNHNIYLLPSPLKKTRLSLKRKNNNKDGEIPKKLPVSRRQLFSNFNFEEGDMSGIQPLATPSSSQSSQPQINIQQNHNETNTPFIPPIWSKNNNNMHSSPLFTSLEGVTSIIENLPFCNPINIFNTLFNDEIMNLIVFQTNLYAQQKQTKTGKSFIRTNLSEIKTFIGINLLMGIKKQCSYRDYWLSSPDLHDSYISSLMPVNRFGWLLAHIHLNDNTVMPKKNTHNYDKLYKLRPFISILLSNFQKTYNPHQIVSIDESMVKFTGRNSNKQYMPKKPIKRGFKIWCLVDKHGYLWNFEIYTGKVGDSVENQLGARVVKQLSQPIQNKNHLLFFDNYFTSYPLMTYLKSKNIHACGTINLTRKHLPNFKKDKDLKLGEYDWFVDQGDILIVKWRDKRIVSLLSNFHNPEDATAVQRRSNYGFMSKSFKKARKWWHRLFFHFIDTAIVNSHVIYKQTTNTNITMKDFRREISRSLVSKTLVEKRAVQNKSKISPVELKKNKPFVPNIIRLEQAAHQPQRGTRRRCARCSTKKNEVRTEWMCCVCNVPLCLGKNKNCFALYHNTQEG
ncbi:hypothetical protein AGLY_017789 [Aphis glycines]|uniref:PiggyBac transposable element-derived protein domain-containing protein n=1 Tax=Aphis glycines TaxID=307491 RepID=A0A6G0SUJ2_APHGL|nr:hypothetical protein AGLY_017789 [Aphis glycines]